MKSTGIHVAKLLHLSSCQVQREHHDLDDVEDAAKGDTSKGRKESEQAAASAKVAFQSDFGTALQEETSDPEKATGSQSTLPPDVLSQSHRVSMPSSSDISPEQKHKPAEEAVGVSVAVETGARDVPAAVPQRALQGSAQGGIDSQPSQDDHAWSFEEKNPAASQAEICTCWTCWIVLLDNKHPCYRIQYGSISIYHSTTSAALCKPCPRLNLICLSCMPIFSNVHPEKLQ